MNFYRSAFPTNIQRECARARDDVLTARDNAPMEFVRCNRAAFAFASRRANLAERSRRSAFARAALCAHLIRALVSARSRAWKYRRSFNDPIFLSLFSAPLSNPRAIAPVDAKDSKSVWKLAIDSRAARLLAGNEMVYICRRNSTGRKAVTDISVLPR